MKITTEPSAREQGNRAEQQACDHLQRQGLKLLARNWHCRHGELDLVMLEHDTVVFVEVRYRRHLNWGGAIESIDSRKRARLEAAAQAFLQQHQNLNRKPCRFDVVAVQASQSSQTLSWIKNAFDT